MKNKISLKKITNWEYWPSFMFYIPNVPYGCYLALKAGSTMFFTTANPSIKNSGDGTESKHSTMQLVPKEYRPTSIFVTPNSIFQDVVDSIEQNKIAYPLIAKPDIGFRGLLVKKIASEEELKKYLQTYKINIIIQDFIDYKNECGIFYYRNPNSKKGTISSLTLKNFLSVTGDGVSTLKELIESDDRANRYLLLFEDIHKEDMHRILKKDEIIQLTDIGNHSKGTQFINGNHLISNKLNDTFDTFSNAIDGWYYGRIDIKYDNFEDLENGKNFKVLEINGIMSEPTHIYDKTNNTYFKSLKAIRNHWKSVYEISSVNHKEKKIAYSKPVKFVKEMISLKKYAATLKRL